MKPMLMLYNVTHWPDAYCFTASINVSYSTGCRMKHRFSLAGNNETLFNVNDMFKTYIKPIETFCVVFYNISYVNKQT